MRISKKKRIARIQRKAPLLTEVEIAKLSEEEAKLMQRNLAKKWFGSQNQGTDGNSENS